MATPQTLAGAPLPWSLLKEMNEAWWEWARHEEEPLLRGRGPEDQAVRRTDVLAIRAAVARGNTCHVLALDYDIDVETIGRIARGDIHADIT